VSAAGLYESVARTGFRGSPAPARVSPALPR